MSLKKIYDEICIGLVQLENFKYTYNEFINFIEKVKEEKKKNNKKKKINEKYELELMNYRRFIIYYRNKGYNLKETLDLWNKRQKE
jgi:hypothetical protein